MGTHAKPVSDAAAAVSRFEAMNSRDGRLAYYARGRLRAFWLRQTLTALGSVAIAALDSLALGLVLAGLALAGEAVDLLLLRRALSLLQHQDGPQDRGRRAARLAVAGALIQGATIAACVILPWRLIELTEARFFAASFLIAAAINAGLSRPQFKPAADLRLALFLTTGTTMLALDWRMGVYGGWHGFGYLAASVGLLAYISLLFIQLLERNHDQRRRNEAALLAQQMAQEQARAEMARMVEEMQRLALVAKHASDSILISAPDGRIQWVNEAFTRITGYAFHEAVGHRPADLLNADDTDPQALERLAAARRDRVPARVELLNRTRTGRTIWVETSIIPVFDDQGGLKAWIAVERDISQAKEREEELARARVAAEEAGQSKSRFLANMSHEIRTPMNGVIGVAELLAETRLTRAQAGYVETILESGRALLDIINDILDLAKLQSGKATLEAAAFSPRACIEGALRILGPTAAKKGLDLRLEGPVPEGFLLGDEGKLRQIVLNLAGNAVKFTREGAVTLRLRLPPDDGGMTEIEVQDTGIGIAPDRIEAIFESFSQADNGIGRQFGGTGLGLTICSMLAEQMGGGISVRSEVGHGSTFTLRLRLPRAADPARPAVLSGAGKAAEPRLRPGLCVLVAEDNRTNMMIVRKMLAPAVRQLIEAVNGEEAVTLYRDRRPDLVLMDVSMPLKDGLQATRDIRRFEAAQGLPRCPVLALTANAFGEDREACRAAGLDGFLVKPLSRLDLLQAIAEHCPEASTQATDTHRPLAARHG